MLQGLLESDAFLGLVLEQLVDQVLGFFGEDHIVSELVGSFEGVGQDFGDGVVVEGEGPGEPG